MDNNNLQNTNNNVENQSQQNIASEISLSYLESLRITIKKQITTIIIIMSILMLALLVATKGKAIGFIVFGIILTAMLVTLIPRKNRIKFDEAYKQYFVKRSLETIFTDLYYSPNQGIPRSVIGNTGMMNTGDIFSSNDYIQGKYKGILFRQSDVDIQEESTDSEGHTTYYTIFRGRWMIFDFNKPFKANIQVVQKGFGANRVQFSFKKEEKFKKVKMESEDFNKRFKVYAQNELEAFYILTPHIMEKMIKLDEDNNGRLLLCFVNNELHVGVNDGKDSFEYNNFFKPIDEQKELEKTSKDIKQITMFIDELNLDNDLFRREV